nr:hypothetical protein [Tanacetum cinerariifolium]
MFAMIGSDATITPTLLSDKLALVIHHHLLTRVPVKLDLEIWNYGLWEYFFDQLCSSYKIFTTLSDALQQRLVVARLKSAKEAWDLLTDIVKENKRSRTSALKAELRSITLGDLTIEAYFRKIDSLMTILASLDSIMNDEDAVHYVIAGLPDKYYQEKRSSRGKASTLDFKRISSPTTLAALRSTTNPEHATTLHAAFTIGTLHDPTSMLGI